MSASAMGTAWCNMLSAGSIFGSCVSTCSYAVMEVAASAAAVISWTNQDNTIMTMGSGRQRRYTIHTDIYVRDTGDPEQLLSRVWYLGDLLTSVAEADQTLQGTAQYIDRIVQSRDPQLALNVAGATWLPFSMEIAAVEWN